MLTGFMKLGHGLQKDNKKTGPLASGISTSKILYLYWNFAQGTTGKAQTLRQLPWCVPWVFPRPGRHSFYFEKLTLTIGRAGCIGSNPSRVFLEEPWKEK